MSIQTILKSDLKINSKSKLNSSKALLNAKLYNDAIYLAGYSIELALKYKFCEKLGIDFPEKIDDIKLKTHNLNSLLYISGELNLNSDPDWAMIKSIDWNENLRYSLSPISQQTAQNMIKSCENLLIQFNVI